MLSVDSGSRYRLLSPQSPNNGLHPMVAFGVHG